MKRKTLITRFIIAAALVVFLLGLSAPLLSPAKAGEIDFTAENGYRAIINDEAGLLDDTEHTALLEEMKKVLPYGGAAFETTDYNIYTASRYAELKYAEYFGQRSGTLFLIDMDNREIYIHSNGDIYRTVSDTRAHEITDNIYTYASRGEYYECAKNAFNQITTILEGGRLSTPMKYATNAAFAVGIALLINFLIVYRQRRKPKEVYHLTMAATKDYADAGNKPVRDVAATMTKQKKFRHVESSGGGGFSGGGGGGGGGFSGGGGGGGGGGHSF